MGRHDISLISLQLSLFIAASCSYRQDTTLRPFPPMCIFGGEKNVDFLLSVIKKLPSLSELKQSLQDGNAGLDLDVLKLLVWVLHGGNGLVLKVRIIKKYFQICTSSLRNFAVRRSNQ